MLTKIQARFVEFFRRPAVQSAVRHLVVTAAGAGFAFVAVHGVAGVAAAGGAGLLIRAIWLAVRPEVQADAESVLTDAVPAVPQTEAGASGS